MSSLSSAAAGFRALMFLVIDPPNSGVGVVGEFLAPVSCVTVDHKVRKVWWVLVEEGVVALVFLLFSSEGWLFVHLPDSPCLYGSTPSIIFYLMPELASWSVHISYLYSYFIFYTQNPSA